MGSGLDAIVLEGGLWLIKDHMRKFDLFRDRLRKIVRSLVDLKKERKVCFMSYIRT